MREREREFLSLLSEIVFGQFLSEIVWYCWYFRLSLGPAVDTYAFGLCRLGFFNEFDSDQSSVFVTKKSSVLCIDRIKRSSKVLLDNDIMQSLGKDFEVLTTSTVGSSFKNRGKSSTYA